MFFGPQTGYIISEVVRFNTYFSQCSYLLSLEQVHLQSKLLGVMLLAPKSLVHCHQGSVLLYVKCGSTTKDARAIGRSVAGITAYCWIFSTYIVKVTASQTSIVVRVGFHCPFKYVSC